MKLPNLIVVVGDGCDRAEHSFCNGRLAVSVECGKKLFPDLRLPLDLENDAVISHPELPLPTKILPEGMAVLVWGRHQVRMGEIFPAGTRVSYFTIV